MNDVDAGLAYPLVITVAIMAVIGTLGIAGRAIEKKAESAAAVAMAAWEEIPGGLERLRDGDVVCYRARRETRTMECVVNREEGK